MYKFLEWCIWRWNDGIDVFLKLLGQSPQSFQGGAGWRVVEALHPIFISIGAVLVPLFFMYSLVSETVDLRDKFSLEKIFKMFIRLILAEWLVIHCIDIILALFESIGALISMVTNGIQLTHLTIAPEVQQMIESANFFESILPFTILLLVVMAAYVCSYVMLFLAYFRFFKIYTAVSLAPIAMAPLAGSGAGNTTRQFSKYMISVTMEAIVMIIAIMVFTAIANSGSVAVEDTSNMWSLVLYFMQILFGMFITVGGVKAAESTVKNVLGL